MHISLPFTWPYALVFWIVLIWAFAPEMTLVKRSEPRVKEEDSPDAGSMRLIIVGNQLGLFSALAISFVAACAFPARMQQPLFWSGIALIIGGSLLRRHCWRVLGQHFTGDVRAAADQPVVERGAYRFVRHPSYSGGMLLFIGVALALGSWGSLLIMTIEPAIVYAYRISVEERALASTIGEPYREYMKRRKRLIPFVY